MHLTPLPKRFRRNNDSVRRDLQAPQFNLAAGPIHFLLLPGSESLVVDEGKRHTLRHADCFEFYDSCNGFCDLVQQKAMNVEKLKDDNKGLPPSFLPAVDACLRQWANSRKAWSDKIHADLDSERTEPTSGFSCGGRKPTPIS